MASVSASFALTAEAMAEDFEVDDAPAVELLEASVGAFGSLKERLLVSMPDGTADSAW